MFSFKVIWKFVWSYFKKENNDLPINVSKHDYQSFLIAYKTTEKYILKLVLMFWVLNMKITVLLNKTRKILKILKFYI